jgi:hypothetical protein
MLAHSIQMLIITLCTLVGLITPGSKTAPCGKDIAIIWLGVVAHRATADF